MEKNIIPAGCEYCNKYFLARPSSKRRFCSQECFREYQHNFMVGTCKKEGCNKSIFAKGFCKTHYGTFQIKNYRTRNPEYVERHRERQRLHMRIKNAKLTQEERKIKNDKYKNWRNLLKTEIYNMHGGPKCACCGENEKAFLELDHINGGGNKHRRSLKNQSSISLYLDLKKQGFPSGFQVLCANCNMAKTRIGICPHKRK